MTPTQVNKIRDELSHLASRAKEENCPIKTTILQAERAIELLSKENFRQAGRIADLLKAKGSDSTAKRHAARDQSLIADLEAKVMILEQSNARLIRLLPD
jgi:hypothetical protein